jgi:hypothetical protein
VRDPLGQLLEDDQALERLGDSRRRIEKGQPGSTCLRRVSIQSSYDAFDGRSTSTSCRSEAGRGRARPPAKRRASDPPPPTMRNHRNSIVSLSGSAAGSRCGPKAGR